MGDVVDRMIELETLTMLAKHLTSIGKIAQANIIWAKINTMEENITYLQKGDYPYDGNTVH